MIDNETIEQMYGEQPSVTKPTLHKPEFDNDVVDQMYGKQPVTKPSSPATQQDDVLDELYPDDPETRPGNPYALDNDVTDDLYGAESIVKLDDNVDLTLISEDVDEQYILRDNLGYMASTAGATQSDITSLVETCNEQLLTGHKYDQADVMTTLYQQHGKELKDKLAAAQELVKSYPELSEWLDSTGAGDNPKVINQIMNIAAYPRAQSRLNFLKQLKRGK